VLTVNSQRTQYRISKILEMLLPLIKNVLCTLYTFKAKTYFIIFKTERAGIECAFLNRKRFIYTYTQCFTSMYEYYNCSKKRVLFYLLEMYALPPFPSFLKVYTEDHLHILFQSLLSFFVSLMYLHFKFIHNVPRKRLGEVRRF